MSGYSLLEFDSEEIANGQPNTLVYSGYTKCQNTSTGKVFVRIESINPGSCNLPSNATLTATVTTRKFLRLGIPQYIEKFKQNQKPNHVWSFGFSDKERSSFIILLMQKKFFTEKEIGEIELNLDAFESNCVTTHEFTLHTPQTNVEPPRIRVTVHVSQDGCENFKAPQSNTLKDNFEIQHLKTIYEN